MDKLQQLGTKVNPLNFTVKDGQWFITDPQAVGRKGFFCITAPWCGHCVHLASSMQKAKSIHPFSSFYVVGDESRQSQRLMEAIGAEGFPSMYTFDTTGKLTPYEGSRAPEAIVQEITSGQTGGANGLGWW